MSHQLELPDDLYSRLASAALREGTTPLGWIEQRLPAAPEEPRPGKTMADLFGDSVGKFHSGGQLRASERVSELFGEYLEQKRREGRL